MKKIIMTILLICVIAILTAEEYKEMGVDFKIGDCNRISYRFEKVKITPQQYILTINMQNVAKKGSGNARIDIIHNGSLDNPYPVLGYKYGTDITLEPDDLTRFKIYVPRSDNIVYVNGMGRYKNHTTIDLTTFDSYIPKSLEVKTDNIKPILSIINPADISQTIRTDETSFSISGKATDNKGIGYVEINGKTIYLDPENRFRHKIALKLGLNVIQVKAVDFFNNSDFTSINIYRTEYKKLGINFSDVDFPMPTSNNNPNAIAVVFGIEEYQYGPNVTNAYNDADIMRDYLSSTFGLKRNNIYFRHNERATSGEFEKVFSDNGWIAKNADKDSDIYVFYAGRGLASTSDKSGYLIPNDTDSNYANTGYSLSKLFLNLSKIKSRSTTIILDTCFSGISRENETVIAYQQPISIKIEQLITHSNLNVFTASSDNEMNSGYPQKLHGLFTYFFLKGLNKNADYNDDRKITLGEMEHYLKENVSLQSEKMGREQNPQLFTNNKDHVLLEY